MSLLLAAFGCGRQDDAGVATPSSRAVGADAPENKLWEEAVARWDQAGDTLTAGEQQYMTGRYLSFAIKGAPPAAQDLTDLASASVDWSGLVARWKATPTYRKNVERILSNTLKITIKNYDPGYGANFGGMILSPKPDNPAVHQIHYYAPCADTDTVTYTADQVWFLEGSETIRVCKHAVEPNPKDPTYHYNRFLTRQYANRAPQAPSAYMGSRDHCGPNLLACFAEPFDWTTYPYKYQPLLNAEVVRRSSYYYDRSESFEEILFGRKGYVNRWLAWQRLVMDGALYEERLTPEKAMAFLKAIPRDSFVEVEWPEELEQTYGLVNSPQYMNFYNSGPRARAGGLVTQLLCKMEWSRVQTETTSLINAHLDTAFAAPAARSPCGSTCHVNMDNMASLFMGIGFAGRVDFFKPDDVRFGEAFGQKGEGIGVIAETLTSLPRFQACMAETYFRGLSGIGFRTVAEADRQVLATAASQGPRQLVDAVVDTVVKSQTQAP